MSIEKIKMPEALISDSMSPEQRIALLEESMARVNEYNQSVTKALTHVLERLKDLEPIAGWATLSAKKFEDFRTAYTLERASKLYKKARSVVFVSKGFFGDNVKYAYLAFCEYARGKDIAVHFLTDDSNQYDLLKSHNLPVLHYDPEQWSLDEVNTVFTAKVAVLNDNFHPYAMKTPKAFGMLQGAKKMQLWHGIPIKKVGLMYMLRSDNVLLEELIASAGFYDVFVTPDSASKDDWGQMFAFKELAPLGYPRNDVLLRKPVSNDLLNTDTDTISLFEEAKREGRPTILYAPTFRDDAASGWFDKAGIAALAEHARNKNYAFAINLHPFEQGNVAEFKKSFPGIHFVAPGMDIYPVLHYADQLITDYSSLAFDFLLVDRPITFFRPDHENYMNKQRGFIPGRERMTPGTVVTGVAELSRAVDSSVNYLKAPATDPFRIARHELRGRLFDHVDGNASQRVCEKIEAMIDSD